MPKKECAACLLPIVRTAGNHTSSVLCTKCSRLYHPNCFNPFCPNLFVICHTCEISRKQRDKAAKPVAAYRTFSLPTKSALSAASSSAEVVASSQAPALSAASATSIRSSDQEVASVQAHAVSTSSKRNRSSPPDISQSIKVFRPTPSTSTLVTDMITDMDELPSDTPPWARVFFKRLDVLTSGVQELGQKIDAIGTRVSVLEKDVDYISDKTNAMQVSHAYRDTCEVRISGIPRDLLASAQSLDEATRKVLTAMQCTRAIDHIYKSRVFDNKNSEQGTTGIAAVQFDSTVVRDDVISSGRKLKDKTASSVFGVGGDTGIYVNPILPSPIHKLSGAARAQARALNYPPPRVCHTGVYMRRSFDAPLTPITFASDLQHLAPNEPNTARL